MKQWHYTQPREVLNLAWDRYMELSLLDTPEGAPSLPDLTNLEPADVSRLFDIAITAYRQDVSDGEIPEWATEAARRALSDHPRPGPGD